MRQFNFYDHSKIILSSQGLLVTHLDKDYHARRFKLSEVMAIAMAPPSDYPDELKFNQRLVDKIKYCKEVLIGIKNASSGSAPVPDPQRLRLADTDAADEGSQPASGRSSKQSVR